MTPHPAAARHLPAAGALVVAAIYALQGSRVSWPLEPAPYDLLVEPPDGAAMLRVQVKTCTTQQHGTWICWVTRSRYARVPGGKRRTSYAPGDVDVLAVVTGDLDVYLLPFEVVAGRTAITLRSHTAYRAATVGLLGGAAVAEQLGLPVP